MLVVVATIDVPIKYIQSLLFEHPHGHYNRHQRLENTNLEILDKVTVYYDNTCTTMRRPAQFSLINNIEKG